MDVVGQALLKKYIEDSLLGAGALKGDKGDKGDAGEISVGTVTSGTVASVTNSGTKTNAVFDFVLPKIDIVDSLTSTDSTKPLSAKQGKVLEDNKVDKSSIITTLDSSCTDDQVASAKAVYDIVPTDTHIKEISLLGELVADTTKYGDDILYFPCGVHIFESNAIASKFINAPVKQAGTLYVTSITPNKDMNTDEYVYRNYRYETYYGVIYTRSLMKGSLSDGIRRDSGWNRVCTTKVADVAKTSFSFSSTTYYTASSGQNWYMVKDGLATISLVINVNQPYHPTSSNLYYPITGLPKPISDYSNSIIAWDDTSGDTLSFMLYADGKLFVLGGESGKQYRITFSYPVAES